MTFSTSINERSLRLTSVRGRRYESHHASSQVLVELGSRDEAGGHDPVRELASVQTLHRASRSLNLFKEQKNLPDPGGIFQPARPFPFRQRHQHPRQLTEPRAFLLGIFQNLTRLNRIRELLPGDLLKKHDVILIAHTDTITKITKITKNNQK